VSLNVSYYGENMKSLKLIGLSLCVVFLMSACALTERRSPEDRRSSILDMRDRTLTELYRVKPGARKVVSRAPGYAVFSNANVNIIFASFSGGYGVVTNNKTGRKTYMKMGEVGIGLGLGIKDFRAVFVFHRRSTMNQFIDHGWQFGAHVDAAAKASDKGGAIGGEALIGDITIYQLTKTGLALQATLKGTKYWRVRSLNE